MKPIIVLLERENHLAKRHPAHLGQPRRRVVPVVDRKGCQGGVERPARKRQSPGDPRTTGAALPGRCAIITSDGSTAITRRPGGL